MYYQSTDKNFSLYKGDSLQILSQISNQFDMIFADPPYFLSNGGKKIQGRRMVSVNKGEWDKKNQAMILTNSIKNGLINASLY